MNIEQNILFLDYDGVVNTDRYVFNGIFNNTEGIKYIEKFCKEYSFEIVVTSSWKHNPKYKDFLYNSGLSKSVEIIGCTDITSMGREYEINSYLEKHPEIEKYLIIDDVYLSSELGMHQIQTSFNTGYNKEKYEETIYRYNTLYNKNS